MGCIVRYKLFCGTESTSGSRSNWNYKSRFPFCWVLTLVDKCDHGICSSKSFYIWRKSSFLNYNYHKPRYDYPEISLQVAVVPIWEILVRFPHQKRGGGTERETRKIKQHRNLKQLHYTMKLSAVIPSLEIHCFTILLVSSNIRDLAEPWNASFFGRLKCIYGSCVCGRLRAASRRCTVIFYICNQAERQLQVMWLVQSSKWNGCLS